MTMIITNARIVLENETILGSIKIVDDTIAKVSTGRIDAQGTEDVLDANGYFVMPGVVDLHTHGSGGYDFMDGEASDIVGAASSLAAHGTTTCLPTTLTSSDDELFSFLGNFNELKRFLGMERNRDAGLNMAKMPGLHLEGPYFDMEQKGAQDPRYIRNPDPKHYMAMMEASNGSIKRWSVAPELEGALEMIGRLSKEGVLISAGHTAATYDDISKAYDCGMRLLTHFYSGMSTITRKGGFRVLGTVEGGYLIDDLDIELICDGMHLPPELLAMIFKLKRNDRIIACSDSMRGAAMPSGPSVLGPKHNGTACIIEDGIAKMPDRTCFAGSVATGDRLVRTLYKTMGMKMEQVSRLASLRPAQLIGMDSEIGSIREGKKADLLICDEDVNLKHVLIDGHIVLNTFKL